ncbi:hypothetical protein [Blastococcus goldschmidtiae]|uniref:Uncharacterized protein n=1 Tax=Blastococcus goldschmidtiae TaxID=3075546 RepID=A0ABU2KDX9_9ACTN|nr:hypothetical protein [Blastococcus sp. DSM 46792]MDT0278391.1 hypothetical protein [Blastococcus sp. DSM 46792]
MLDDVCANANHVAPATGGACPCGLVTRVPATRPVAEENPSVRDLVARCLVERGGLADLPDLRRRADRVLGALAEAGLLVAPVAGPTAGRRPA